MAPHQVIEKYSYFLPLRGTYDRELPLPSNLSSASVGSWTLSTREETSVSWPPLHRHHYSLKWKGACDLRQIRSAVLSLEQSGKPESGATDALPYMRARNPYTLEEVVDHKGLGNDPFIKLELQYLGGEQMSIGEVDHFARLASSFSAALSFRQPHDVRLVFPGGRELYSHSTLLKTTPFFADLLSSDFSEGQKKVRGQETKKVTPTKGAFIDSDDEDDDGEEETASISETLGGHSTFQEIIIPETSYITMKALLVWLGTGFRVAFAPLTSSFRDKSRDIAQSRRTAAILKLQDSKSFLPYPCSPKSLYRLAHLHSQAELCKLALNNIAEQLTTANAAHELFSDVTAAYEEVADVVVEFVAVHWEEVQASDGWKQMEKGVQGGEQLSSSVAVQLMKRLKGR